MIKIDTSGQVDGRNWPDLTSFAQGYINALFAEWGESLDEVAQEKLSWPANSIGFSDLAPETLARVIADCDGLQSAYAIADGAKAWEQRQLGDLPDFPPLTVRLGDDGKVRFA